MFGFVKKFRVSAKTVRGVVIGLIVGAMLTGGIAFAATNNNKMTGCLDSSGALTKIATGNRPVESCVSGETKVSWNKKGRRGKIGKTGAQGETGPTGLQGPAGARGETGTRGATGPKGEPGPSGDVGARGAEGPQGPPGEQGEDGSSGARGPKGDPGEPAAAAFYIVERDHTIGAGPAGSSIQFPFESALDTAISAGVTKQIASTGGASLDSTRLERNFAVFGVSNAEGNPEREFTIWVGCLRGGN